MDRDVSTAIFANTNTIHHMSSATFIIKRRIFNPPFNLKTYGARSFSMASPSLWNALPSNIRNSSSVPVLEINLKLFLLKKHFDNLLVKFFVVILVKRL